MDTSSSMKKYFILLLVLIPSSLGLPSYSLRNNLNILFRGGASHNRYANSLATDSHLKNTVLSFQQKEIKSSKRVKRMDKGKKKKNDDALKFPKKRISDTKSMKGKVDDEKPAKNLFLKNRRSKLKKDETNFVGQRKEKQKTKKKRHASDISGLQNQMMESKAKPKMRRRKVDKNLSDNSSFFHSSTSESIIMVRKSRKMKKLNKKRITELEREWNTSSNKLSIKKLENNFIEKGGKSKIVPKKRKRRKERLFYRPESDPKTKVENSKEAFERFEDIKANTNKTTVIEDHKEMSPSKIKCQENVQSDSLDEKLVGGNSAVIFQSKSVKAERNVTGFQESCLIIEAPKDDSVAKSLKEIEDENVGGITREKSNQTNHIDADILDNVLEPQLHNMEVLNNNSKKEKQNKEDANSTDKPVDPVNQKEKTPNEHFVLEENREEIKPQNDTKNDILSSFDSEVGSTREEIGSETICKDGQEMIETMQECEEKYMNQRLDNLRENSESTVINLLETKLENDDKEKLLTEKEDINSKQIEEKGINLVQEDDLKTNESGGNIDNSLSTNNDPLDTKFENSMNSGLLSETNNQLEEEINFEQADKKVTFTSVKDEIESSEISENTTEVEKDFKKEKNLNEKKEETKPLVDNIYKRCQQTSISKFKNHTIDTAIECKTFVKSHESVKSRITKRIDLEVEEDNITVSELNQTTSKGEINMAGGEIKEGILQLRRCEDHSTDITVSIVTWNLAETIVPEEDAKFIRKFRETPTWKRNGESGSDIVLISSQECENIKPRRSEGHRSRELRRLMIKMLGKKYIPLAIHSLGGIQFGLFCKRTVLSEIEFVSLADVTCGIGNVIHNKGAIAAFLQMKARKNYLGSKKEETHSKSLKFLFVVAHMAAHVKNVGARNMNYWRIVSELEAQAPPRFLFPRNAAGFPNREGTGSYLLDSVDRVFFCGDLNYRIDLPREITESSIAIMKRLLKRGNASARLEKIRMDLLLHDQLSNVISQRIAFPGFSEGKITFMPTFKFDKGSDEYDTSHKQRIPAWTDRVLYKPFGTKILQYKSEPGCVHSDHRPVHATFRVSMLGRVTVNSPDKPRSK